MVLLKEIQLNNFLSHSKTELKFNANQKLLIDGKSGSGKSSIVDGLIWAFFNKGRSDNKSLIKHGSENAKVIVILEDDENGTLYKVERTITSKNKHELKISEKLKGKKFSSIKTNGTKETQEYLEKNILQSSYVLFVNSIVYLQENDEDFVRQSALKKKDIILEIIKASDYDDYLKKAKASLQELKTEHEVILSKIDGEKTFINSNKDVAKKLEEYEKEEIRLQKEIELFKKEYQKYTERQEEINKQKTDIVVAKERLANKLKESNTNIEKIKELNSKIISLSTIDISSLKVKSELLKVKQKEIDDYNNSRDLVMKWNTDYSKALEEKPAVQDFEIKLVEINQSIIEILKEKAEECPKCGYIAPNWSENHQTRLKYQEDTLFTTQSKFDNYKKKLDEYAKSVVELGKQPTLTLTPTEYDLLKNEINDLSKINEELIKAQNIENDIKVAEKELESITKIQSSLKKEVEIMTIEVGKKDFSEEESSLKNSIIKINGKIDEVMMKLSGNRELLAVAKHSKEKIVESEIKLKHYKELLLSAEEKIESLELVKGAFGPNGVKAIVIDYLLPELEERINNILSKLSDFRIELSTQKSGAGKDVMIEGLFINIINEVGEQFDFQNYSGGEKSRISYAIFEALASLSKINFRILDEAFFALDNETATNFISIVSMLQKNVSTVICITHLEQIKDLFDEKISVIKTNGDSKISI